jgi:hypothetical protein
MTLLTTIQEVTSFIGVARPQAVFPNLASSRTMQELVSLATEMAQRIAYNTREWQKLKTRVTFFGDGIITPPATSIVGTEAFSLPANYQRMLLNSNVWRSTSAIQPMRFISDADEWLQRRARGIVYTWGEWIILADGLHVWPVMSAHTSSAWLPHHAYNIGDLAVDMDIGTTPYQLVWQVAVKHTSGATFAGDRLANSSLWVLPAQDIDAVTATFNYLDKNCINLASGGRGDAFTSDNDSFVLDERLLKLGMIWQWKGQKGSPYAEDMANYQDALQTAQGADKPSPIIVNRSPISSYARVAYPYPIDPNMRPL